MALASSREERTGPAWRSVEGSGLPHTPLRPDGRQLLSTFALTGAGDGGGFGKAKDRPSLASLVSGRFRNQRGSAFLPYAVLRRPSTVTAWILRVHRALDRELEKLLVVARLHATGDEVGANFLRELFVRDRASTSHYEELVVYLGRRKRMQCETPIASQIAALVARSDQDAPTSEPSASSEQ